MKICIPVFLFLFGCSAVRKIPWPQRYSQLSGSEFYSGAASMNWKQRDSFVVVEIFAGNIPDFFKRFVPIKVSYRDSAAKKT
ncbi:MAG: hypothetical protein N2747_07130 [Chitinophagaceae bacterium]|nr:hypothetical protein [Chitinophagaceae bacterium]